MVEDVRRHVVTLRVFYIVLLVLLHYIEKNDLIYLSRISNKKSQKLFRSVKCDIFTIFISVLCFYVIIQIYKHNI